MVLMLVLAGEKVNFMKSLVTAVIRAVVAAGLTYLLGFIAYPSIISFNRFAGNHDQTSSRFLAEPLKSFEKKRGQLGGKCRRGLLTVPRLGQIFDSNFGCVREDEPQCFFASQIEYFLPIPIGVERATNTGNQLVFFVLFYATKQDGIESSLFVQDIARSLGYRLDNLNGAVKKYLIVQLLDHPIDGGSQKVSFAETGVPDVLNSPHQNVERCFSFYAMVIIEQKSRCGDVPLENILVKPLRVMNPKYIFLLFSDNEALIGSIPCGNS